MNPPSPQILRIVRQGMTDDVKMQMMSYDIICAKIVIDSNWCKYKINSSYLSSYIKVWYHKKWQNSAIMWEISNSNLENGREGPKSRVLWMMQERWQPWHNSKRCYLPWWGNFGFIGACISLKEKNCNCIFAQKLDDGQLLDSSRI